MIFASHHENIFSDPVKACLNWELILAEHPRDTLAQSNLYGWQIMMADFERMRDVMSRILPAWRPSDPEYGLAAEISSIYHI